MVMPVPVPIDVRSVIAEAAAQWSADVTSGAYPTEEHEYR
jgi:ketopantoate hydroxymethyltransferase